MMRTLVTRLALLLLVLLAPAACARSIEIEASQQASQDAADLANVEDVSQPPTLNVPAGLGLDADPPDALSTQADEPASQAGAPQESRWTALAPEAQRAATIASAGAGAALVLGLLAHALGVPLFSRIQSNHLLDNGVRQRVHDMIVANPGITIKEVSGLCAIGWGTAVYHLKRLEGERLIVSERNRQFRRYYKNGGGIVNESKAAFGELKHPVTERLAQSIIASPGSCQKDLCERVGVSAPVAHKYLSRLASAGLVSMQREWKTVRYFATPRLEDLILITKPTLAPVAVAA